jgi:hypothetical protein
MEKLRPQKSGKYKKVVLFRQVASPAEVNESDHLHGPPHIKVEPASPETELMDSTNNNDDLVFMLSSSSKFSPLLKLYSDDLPPITLPPEFRYKPKVHTSTARYVLNKRAPRLPAENFFADRHLVDAALK